VTPATKWALDELDRALGEEAFASEEAGAWASRLFADLREFLERETMVHVDPTEYRGNDYGDDEEAP